MSSNLPIRMSIPAWLQYDITKYRGFRIKYLGPTNLKGSRVKIIDTWFGVSKTIAYHDEPNTNDVTEKAQAYLEVLGIRISGVVNTHGCDEHTMLITKDFNISISKRNRRKCSSN